MPEFKEREQKRAHQKAERMAPILAKAMKRKPEPKIPKQRRADRRAGGDAGVRRAKKVETEKGALPAVGRPFIFGRQSVMGEVGAGPTRVKVTGKPWQCGGIDKFFAEMARRR